MLYYNAFQCFIETAMKTHDNADLISYLISYLIYDMILQ